MLDYQETSFVNNFIITIKNKNWESKTNPYI